MVAIATAEEPVHIDLPDRPVAAVRTPTADAARKVEQVHDAELRLAINFLLRDAGATQRKDLIVAFSRIFGWNRTGNDIGRRLGQLVDRMTASGDLVERDGSTQLPTE